MRYNYNIILGVDSDSQPIVWGWEHANAIAVVGKGGSGKTTNAAYWLSQLACQGVRILMADPHMESKQSLYAFTEHMRPSFIAPCVKSNEDIMSYIEYIHDLGSKRINNEAPTYPLILVIDEFTTFVLNSDETKQAALKLLDSVNQYRKADIRVMLLGQTWGAAVQKISGLRDAISDAIIHKASANDARKFCSFESTAKEAKLLVPGQAYYNDEMIYIPRLTSTSKLVTAQRVAEYNHLPVRIHEDLYDNEHHLNRYA